MTPRILQITDFPGCIVKQSLYRKILAGEAGTVVTSGRAFQKGKTPPKPSLEASLIKQGEPYLIVLKEGIEKDKSIPTGWCSVVRVGEAKFDDFYVDPKTRESFWNYIRREALQPVITDITYDYKIRSDEIGHDVLRTQFPQLLL